MPKGGKQPGAGRPKGSKGGNTIAAEKAREYVINRVASELDPIVTAQLEASRGMWVEETDENGNRIRVYKKQPNLSTGEYLLNQTIGRAKESLDMTTGGEKLATVDALRNEIKSLINEAKK